MFFIERVYIVIGTRFLLIVTRHDIKKLRARKDNRPVEGSDYVGWIDGAGISIPGYHV